MVAIYMYSYCNALHDSAIIQVLGALIYRSWTGVYVFIGENY
jgi:hypothetical protein